MPDDEELDGCEALAAMPDDDYVDDEETQELLHLFPDRVPSDKWEGVFDADPG